MGNRQGRRSYSIREAEDVRQRRGDQYHGGAEEVV